MKEKIKKDVQYKIGSTSESKKNYNQVLEPHISKETITESSFGLTL